MTSNYIKLWIRDAFISASSSFTSASVLSAFFLSRGMNAAQISFYMSFTQAVNFIVSLLFAGITEKFYNTRHALSVLYTAGGVGTFLFAIFCVYKPSTGFFYFAMLIIGSMIQAVAAIRFVFEYKIPCEVIDIGKYSTYVAFSNIFGGCAGILAGIALMMLYESGSFMVVTAIAFIGSGICLLIAAAMNFSLKIINHIKTDEKPLTDPLNSFLRLLQNGDFRALAIPNFIRGFGAGVVAMITVLAISALGLSGSDVPLITTLTYLGTLGSCLIYAFIAKKLGPALSCLIGSLIFSVLSLSFCSSKPVFFAIYLIAYTGYNIVCCAIPEMVYNIAPAEIIGSFHTWRMALTTFGTVISTAIIGMISSVVPEFMILIGGAAAILVCSIWYYRYYNKILRPDSGKGQ